MRELTCEICLCNHTEKNPVTIINEEMVCAECLRDLAQIEEEETYE